MPQETKSDDDIDGDDKSPERESDASGSSEDDPFELKNHIKGITMLVVVCSLLWALSKFGPNGADWFGAQTKALFGLETTDPGEPEKEKPVLEQKKTEPFPEEKPTPPEELVTNGGDPRLANARKTIVEALGGPEKVIVQHVAISTDETKMVAAVKLFEEDGTSRLEEIFFEQDEFETYVSTKDSPVKPVIKIWKPE